MPEKCVCLSLEDLLIRAPRRRKVDTLSHILTQRGHVETGGGVTGGAYVVQFLLHK